tara:strand:- start:151 stop:516 length:366 start_codon:yes stop_codon:yes gene_type:complete
MALSKDRQFRNSPSITLGYHRITQVKYSPEGRVQIQYESYVSKEERSAGGNSIESNSVSILTTGVTREDIPETIDKDGNVISAHIVETQVDNEAGIAPGNVMEYAYAMWKKHPDFLDALDV